MPRPVRTRKPPSAPTEKGNDIAKEPPKGSATEPTKEPTKSAGRTAKKKTDAPVPAAPAPKPRATRSHSAVVEKRPIEEPPKRRTRAAATATKKTTRSSASASTASVAPKSSQKRTTRRLAVKEIEEPASAAAEEDDMMAVATIAAETVTVEVDARAPPSAQVGRPVTPSTALATPSSESEPPASSDRENHSPSPHFPSSPPIIQSTPKQGQRRRVTLEFSPGAGYTPPPPPRPPPASSAERPRLRELEAKTLEPIENRPLEPMEEDDEPEPPASPTPKRGRKTYVESVESLTATPSVEGKQERKPTTYGFFLEGDDEEFVIYSDPKASPPKRQPAISSMDESLLSSTMRPPESSPITSPVDKGKKRRSSGAGVEGEGEETAVEDNNREKEERLGKRRKTRAQKLKKLMNTDDLRELLPRRRRQKDVDVFDIPSTTSEERERPITEEERSEDELSRPGPRRGRSTAERSRPSKVSKEKGKAPAPTVTLTGAKRHTTSRSKTPLTKSAWSRPLVGPGSWGRKGLKTYGKKANKEVEEEGEESDATVTPLAKSDATSSVELADGKVDKEGRKKLKAIADKFKEVDQWKMEFEDFSQSPEV